jgi:hypothetical protein
VYQSYLDELKDLWRQPGIARRETMEAPLVIPSGAKTPTTFGPGNYGPAKQMVKLEGIVVDDAQAKFTGEWGTGSGLKGFIGSGYRYAAPGAKAEVIFTFKVASDGEYEIRYAISPHENRASAAVCAVNGVEQKLNLKVAPSRRDGFETLGIFALKAGSENSVKVSNGSADGFLHADAVWVVPKGK